MSRRYLFSDYCLNPSDRTLTRNGELITVQAQVFDLLHYLIQRPGAVISKDELLDQVWGNHFLGDAVIAQAVKKARAALGDDGRRQNMIRTVHGRGVSFLPQVQRAEPAAPAVFPVNATANSRRWQMMAAAVLVGVLIWLSVPSAQDSPALSGKTLVVFPFENKSGEEDLDWLQLGMAQTTALLLQGAADLNVVAPQDLSALPVGAKNQQIELLGANGGLDASVERQGGQYKLTWQLSSFSSEREADQGEIISTEISQLPRQLADAVLNYLAGQPDAPLPSKAVLQDPLATELYGRALQAMYADNNKQAQALLQAALTREPESVPLRVAHIQASFDYASVAQSIEKANVELESLVLEDPIAAASLIKTIGIELWNSGEIEASAAILNRGLALLEDADAIGLRAATLNALALSLNSQADHQGAWEVASRAELIFRELNDPYHLSLVLTNMAYFAEDQGRIFQAGELHRQALELRQRYQFPQLIAASQYGLARIKRRSGQFDEAEALLNEALGTVTELGLNFDRFDNLEELAEVKMRQRDFDSAHARLDECASLARENGDALGQAWARQVRGRLALRQGKVSHDTLALIEGARADLHTMGEAQDFFTASLELIAAHLYLAEDQTLPPAVVSVFDQLSETEAVNNPVLKLQLDAAQADLLIHQGQRSEAMTRYNELVQRARQIGVSDLEAEYAITLGHLALTQGNAEQAIGMLAIASRWSSSYYRTLALAESVGARVRQ